MTSPPHGAPAEEAATRTPLCDVCSAPCPRGVRRRLVWASELAGDLVLADLCARCAADSDRLIQMYAGESVRVTEQVVRSPVTPAPARRVGGMVLRGIVYFAIAVAAFAVVTLLTSRN